MLTIKNLTKTYRSGKKAVDDLSLEVMSGDIFGFIGHNGAGKTTTLKSIAGILDFDGGEIIINNYSVQSNPLAAKAMIAYIPDNPDLYENLTGIAYLNFIADMFSLDKEEREENIRYYADSFKFTRYLGDVISSYSHGMKQRLNLISALMHRPKLFLLDEPFVGLDPKAIYTLKEHLRVLCDQGSAVFFSSHVLETVERFCNKIAIINEGRLIVNGTTQEVIGDKSLEKLFLELTDND